MRSYKTNEKAFKIGFRDKTLIVKYVNDHILKTISLHFFETTINNKKSYVIKRNKKFKYDLFTDDDF